MSAATKDHVLRAIWNNARGIGTGPAMNQKEWRALVADMGSWFMYAGDGIDMRAQSIGGGMYIIKGTFRYRKAAEQ